MSSAKDLSQRVTAKGGIFAESQYCESVWNDLDISHTDRACLFIGKVLPMQAEGGGREIVAGFELVERSIPLQTASWVIFFTMAVITLALSSRIGPFYIRIIRT